MKIILVIIALGFIFYGYQSWGFQEYLSLDYIKQQQSEILNYYEKKPVEVIIVYFLIYILITAFSIPGAAVMTLVAGALFGLSVGTITVSFASTIGATCAFFIARFIARDFFESKFGRQLEKINQGIRTEGAFYLFALRLVPIFPFFLINIVMGLTKMRGMTFFLVSQLGMLPGTIAYVNAGRALGEIDSLASVLSSEILTAFAFLGVLPLLGKWGVSFYRKQKVLSCFKKPKVFDYNVVVIGAGAAGLVASYIASTIKAKVALVEKDKMGGDCLNKGCVPSKTLIHVTRLIAEANQAHQYGIDGLSPAIDFKRVMSHVHNTIARVAPHDSVERYEGLGVKCLQGEATVLSPYEVSVSGKKLFTKNIIIATGGRPRIPSIEGIDAIQYYTSDTIWRIQELPKRLLVLGGGPIGCELGQCFARLGSSVTIVQKTKTLLPKEDACLGEALREVFLKEEIQVLTNHIPLRFDGNTLICLHEREEVNVGFDAVLVALGRIPNLKGFGLEELGVQINELGNVALDPFMRTNFSNIYLCGDVAGSYQFTHTAAHQAWYASVNALFAPFVRFRLDNRVIPWCTFTDPEIARVGLSEQDAQAQGIGYDISEYDLSDLDRAITDGGQRGKVRVLTEPGRDKILGVAIMGAHAGNIIAEFVLAMKHSIGLNKILGTIHIYPTHAEANKYVAGVWKKNHAPKWALGWLEKWHTFKRN